MITPDSFIKSFEANDGASFLHRKFTKSILLVFDFNYIYPFFVCLFSLRRNSIGINKVYVACTEFMLPEEYRNDIRKFCTLLQLELQFLTVQMEADLPVSKGFNTSTYAKLFAINQLENLCLYLDVDTLIVRGIDELWSEEFAPNQDQAISARLDPGINTIGSTNQAVILSNGRYFNAGVMMIDPNNWSRLDYEAKCLVALDNYSAFGFEWLDQCIFNYLAAGNFTELPSGYNHFTNEWSLDDKEISVFHFAGSHKKPWRVPQGFFHRFLYLRMNIFSFPFREYLNFEKLTSNFLRSADSKLYSRFAEYRRIEFSNSPHVIDLILYRFEMRKYGWIIKYLHRKWKTITSKSKGAI